MIEKFRRVMNSADEVQSLKESIKSSNGELTQLKEEIRNVHHAFEQERVYYSNENKKILGDKRQSLELLNKLCDDFQKELNEFKILKTKLRTEIIEKVSSDIKEEINIYLMNIKNNIENLNKAADEIKKVSSNSAEMLRCMQDLREISKNIKKEDFELSKYADVLRHNDKEKLELMRKIDTLERLIAKQRRFKV